MSSYIIQTNRFMNPFRLAIQPGCRHSWVSWVTSLPASHPRTTSTRASSRRTPTALAAIDHSEDEARKQELPHRKSHRKGTALKTAHTLTTCLTASLLVTACASRGPIQQTQGHGLVGVAGNTFVAVDATSGVATEIATSTELTDVGALAYDPTTQTLYGVAVSTKRPKLITIDVETGEVTAIGTISLPQFYPTRVEGLAFDTSDGTLYAAGGRSAFASDRLLKIDTTTAQATEVARIRGTLQNEVDAMAFVGDELWATDSVAGSTVLYQIDLETGKASAISEPFTQKLTDMTLDPTTHHLLGTLDSKRTLVTMSLGGSRITETGPTHGETDFGGTPLTALTFAGPRGSSTTVFRDGFESGNLARWSKQDKPGRKQDG